MAGENDVRAGGAFVELSLDGFSQVKAGLGQLQKSLQGLGTGLSKIGAVGGVVSGALAAIGAKAISSASQFEEIIGKFDAVFKGQAAEVRKWGETIQAAIKIGRTELLALLGTAQDTFVPLGFAREEATQLSKRIALLAVDLEAFYGTKASEGLELITSALVGNHEAVKRFAVIITEATLKQELMNMGIAGGAKEATEAQKTMARLNIILRGTADAQGAALREAENWNSVTRDLRGAIQDTFVVLGQKLIPLVKPYIDRIKEAVLVSKEWLETNGGFVEGLFKLGKTLAAISVIAGTVGAAIGNWGASAAGAALGGLTVLLEKMGLVDTGLKDIEETLAKTGITFERVMKLVKNAAEIFGNKISIAIETAFIAVRDSVRKFLFDMFDALPDDSVFKIPAFQLLTSFASATGNADRSAAILNRKRGDTIEKLLRENNEIISKFKLSTEKRANAFNPFIPAGVPALIEAIKRDLALNPPLPDFPSGGASGVPKGGVLGFFGGSNPLERLNAFSNRIEMQQLAQQKRMNDHLADIKANTANQTARLA